jgi:hypothetical protein
MYSKLIDLQTMENDALVTLGFKYDNDASKAYLGKPGCIGVIWQRSCYETFTHPIVDAMNTIGLPFGIQLPCDRVLVALINQLMASARPTQALGESCLYCTCVQCV